MQLELLFVHTEEVLSSSDRGRHFRSRGDTGKTLIPSVNTKVAQADHLLVSCSSHLPFEVLLTERSCTLQKVRTLQNVLLRNRFPSKHWWRSRKCQNQGFFGTVHDTHFSKLGLFYHYYLFCILAN